MPSRGTINDRIHVILGKRYTVSDSSSLDYSILGPLKECVSHRWVLSWTDHLSLVRPSFFRRFKRLLRPSKAHIGAMFPICNIPDEQTRVLLGNPTNAFIQQAIFDKSFQLVKPWEETDAL